VRAMYQLVQPQITVVEAKTSGCPSSQMAANASALWGTNKMTAPPTRATNKLSRQG
jgi:hypothetical protein